MIHNMGLANIDAELDLDGKGLFIDQASFLVLLEAATRQIPFDQDWYMSQYPDVQDSIENGEYDTALQHYLKVGFIECRLPYEIKVDEEFYLERYKDVQLFIDHKMVPNAQWHFENHGRSEGRIPYAGFSLFNNATSPSEISRPETYLAA
jgi:hypothetical protein